MIVSKWIAVLFSWILLFKVEVTFEISPTSTLVLRNFTASTSQQQNQKHPEGDKAE